VDRVEFVAIIVSLFLISVIFELIRRRKLGEGYSLLWLFTAVALLILSLWRELLDSLANLIGIFYPPAALFFISFGFILLLLLQFSIIITKLAGENRRLAQRLALLEWQVQQASSETSK
jgi:hypothetical protein